MSAPVSQIINNGYVGSVNVERVCVADLVPEHPVTVRLVSVGVLESDVTC